MYHQFQNGCIEIICGCKFSGKTEELIKRINVLRFSKSKVKVFKHTRNQSHESEVISSNGLKKKSFSVNNAMEIAEIVKGDIDVVAIDDGEMFDDSLITLTQYLASRGVRVIISCLDQDLFGNSFSHVGQLLSKAEFITKLTAVCVKCGSPATRTQVLIDGKIVSSQDNLDLNKKIKYEPRCRHCFQEIGI